jgi:AcrR family transcriptional regulator
MSRYGPGHREEAKAKLLAGVGRGFRKHGYGGIGVDGLAKEAKVTSGALYSHFGSKDAAFKEAVVFGLDELRDNIRRLRAEHGPAWIGIFVDFYLGAKRTCLMEESCALQSLTPEVQRGDDETRSLFQSHVEQVVQAVADGLQGPDPQDRRNRAWALLSVLTGGVTLARSVADAEASNAIAAGLKQTALMVAGAASEV